MSQEQAIWGCIDSSLQRIEVFAKERQVRNFRGIFKTGETYDALKKTDKALEDYNTAVKTNPNDVDPLQNRGDYFYKLDRFEESDIDFQKVLKIDPENAYARMGLGRNCLERKEYQKAIDYFDYC